MVCSQCGTENPAGRKFCRECGAGLAVVCAVCGTGNLPGDKFCGECGSSLIETTASTGPEIVVSEAGEAPERHEPVQERRFVSVLFADLVGFTPFSEKRDPEEVRDFLSDYFDRAGQIVERFGGTVDKYIGDALMAVWGAVKAQEDDAERAVRASLELVDLVGKLGAEAGIPEMALRAGVMTGETAVGPGGNRAGLIIGDLVNTASRLQSIAEPAAVVVGESTYKVVQEAIDFEPLGDQTVKGKTIPVPAYQALRVVGMRGGERRGEGLEPPFVGRVDEMRLLKDLLHASGREHRPRLLSIMGIAGVGKSRLIWEFTKYVDGLVEDVYWHEGRSPAYGEGVTFWALGEMVRRRAGIAEVEDAASARDKLQATLDEWIPEPEERRRLEPRLAGLLGLEEMPSGERGELFAAFRTFFERVATRGTTVLVFEDLHWADEGLLDFIEELPEWSRESPILVITLARPEILERRPTWGAGRRDFMSIHLGPLTQEEMHQLIEGVAPGIPSEVVDELTESAAGIPLYAVELVRMLINDGTLVPDHGGYELVGDLSGLAVPESLHAVIGARLDRLEPDERELLQNAAVLGQSFTADGLSALAGVPEAELEEKLAGLVRNELLEIKQDPRSPERGQHGFVQSLIREVAYGRLARQDKRGRHLAAAYYYESLEDDELASVVASHYLAAYESSPEGSEADELADRAVEALVGAADRAAALHSHEQALALCDQALEVLPETSDRTRIWELAAWSALAAAKWELAEQHARALVDWYAYQGDEQAEVAATFILGRVLVHAQRPDQAIEVLESVLAPISELRRDPGHVSAAAQLAHAFMRTDHPETLAMAERALVAAEELDLIREIADAMNTKGVVLATEGRIREAAALLEGSLRLATEHELPSAELRAQANIAYVLWTDDPPATVRAGVAGLEAARRFGDRDMELFFTRNRVFELEWRADFEGSLAVIDEISQGVVPKHYAMEFQTLTAAIQAMRGEDGEAQKLGTEAGVWAEGITDQQTRLSIGDQYSLVEFASENFAGAHDRLIRIYDEVFSHWKSLNLATHSAAWSRDTGRLEAVEERFGNFQAHGRVIDALELLIDGTGKGLRGEADVAAPIFLELVRVWEGFDIPWETAMTYASWAISCQGHSAADEAATEARTRFEEMGAAGLLETFDKTYAYVQVPA